MLLLCVKYILRRNKDNGFVTQDNTKKDFERNIRIGIGIIETIIRSEEFHFSDSLDSSTAVRLNPHEKRFNP